MNKTVRGPYKYKKDARDLLVHTATALPLVTLDEIESVARERSCTIAHAVRQFVLRGLAAYHNDGLLEEPCATLVQPGDK